MMFFHLFIYPRESLHDIQQENYKLHTCIPEGSSSKNFSLGNLHTIYAPRQGEPEL